VQLGNVKVNLAEYVDDVKGGREKQEEIDGDEGIVRRYLLQESKINSTLKVGIKMRQLEGDTNFIAPPLKTAMVFGGIAGVISTEAGESVDESAGHMPNITSRTREMSEMQDMYRRTLAASWSCGPHDLPPDKLIEDLFAGGDGGAMKPPPPTSKFRFSPTPQQGSPKQDEEITGDSANVSETDSKRTGRDQFLSPNAARRSKFDGRNGHGKSQGPTSNGSSPNMTPISSVSGRGSIEQQINLSEKEKKKRREQRPTKEVSEFDVREDLRSWEIEAR
jgi:N-terminal C2 in EEIG1 and EHBP1 proteins